MPRYSGVCTKTHIRQAVAFLVCELSISAVLIIGMGGIVAVQAPLGNGGMQHVQASAIVNCGTLLSNQTINASVTATPSVHQVISSMFQQVCANATFQSLYAQFGVADFTFGPAYVQGVVVNVTYGFAWTNGTTSYQEYWVGNVSSGVVSGPFTEQGPAVTDPGGSSQGGVPSGVPLEVAAVAASAGLGIGVAAFVLLKRRI